MADGYGLLSTSAFDKFIQLESDFDEAREKNRKLADKPQSFWAGRKDDIFKELRLTLLKLQDAPYTMQFVAAAFLDGAIDAQQAILYMRSSMRELDLHEHQRFSSLYQSAFDFHELPERTEMHLWDAALLQRKSDENRELCKSISAEMREVCSYILENPVKDIRE
ncbi:MAG: hypothetical protein KGS72_26830 [Cyanobacteria bacterium REEB67]|nr:hypothetical protein [Cyanobacteria bacterium REEB67]